MDVFTRDSECYRLQVYISTNGSLQSTYTTTGFYKLKPDTATVATNGLMSFDDKKNLTYYVKGTQTGTTGS